MNDPRPTAGPLPSDAHQLPIVDEAGPAVVTIEWSGMIVSAGPGFASMIGSTGVSPVGRSLYELFAGAERSALYDLLVAGGRNPLEVHTATLGGRRDDALPLRLGLAIPAGAATADHAVVVATRASGPVMWAGGRTAPIPDRAGPDHVLSHDVRATVRNARNFVSLFGRKLAADEAAAAALPGQYLDTALRALAAGDEALERVVWFLRLDNDPLVMQTVSLSDLVSGARRQAEADLDELAALPDQAGLAGPLDVEISHGLTADELLVGDPVLLTWVFAELLKNARKFAPPGASMLIETTSTDAARVDVRVTNTAADPGRPIEPSLAEDAFQLGRMLQPRGERPGVGLGLSLCRLIVARHGGHIAFELPSEPGTDPSTTVLFRLLTAPSRPVPATDTPDMSDEVVG